MIVFVWYANICHLLKAVFHSSFGYDTVKILIKGEGGLPNSIETRLDIPIYVENSIRAAYRKEVVSNFNKIYP